MTQHLGTVLAQKQLELYAKSEGAAPTQTEFEVWFVDEFTKRINAIDTLVMPQDIKLSIPERFLVHHPRKTLAMWVEHVAFKHGVHASLYGVVCILKTCE